ncbi:Ig-like domain-containing protein [Amantichitinum ursilacus]|uniref:Bacterial Ig-like domain (Group 1) n=1 Tax=Amantichitinum ursilacus TaxID=857265 RepID=A0A0N0GMQ2_9NEIS|nr:Ig-like domain-containing protein [Amantichitinum ursilacus]KPC51744.1 Bacterial Ig-like domain (group 1) [Amantichitinum ursilacus]
MINLSGAKALRASGLALTTAAMLVLAGCGGGSDGSSLFNGGGTTGTPTPTSTPTAVPTPVSAISLLATSPTLNSDGATPVTISALLKDSTNNVIPSQAVSFTVDSGAVIVTNGGLTDSTGVAKATVTTGNDATNRTITVTATSASMSKTIVLSVSGTSLQLSGATSLAINATTNLTATLTDSSGKALANQSVSLKSALGNTFSAAGAPVTSATTDTAGTVTFAYNAVNSGSDTVTISALGASVSKNITVTSQVFTLSPTTNSQAGVDFSQTPPTVVLNTPISLTLHYANGSTPLAGRTITFNATRGTISSTNPATTDANGNAVVTLQSATSGQGTVTASTSGITGSYDVYFLATNPTSVKLQPNVSKVSAGGSTTVTATVRDAANNLVRGQQVSFTVTNDTTGGTLSTATATTDDYGQASTKYTAGAVSGGSNGVTITGTVTGTSPAVSGTTTLTVGGTALFITLGTGNTISTGAGSGASTQYSMPYQVLVSDSAGNPVKNVAVTVAVIPQFYRKGSYAQGSAAWVQTIATQCANEDSNRNGILDPLEDINGNGTLEPGNVANVLSATGVTTNTVTTDDTGSAFIQIVYPKDRAYWVGVTLFATATVSGTEANSSANFVLPGITGDYTNLSADPPGRYSPYGVASSCTNPL